MQGMVFSLNPFRLARCGSRATSAVRTVVEASAAALMEAVAWLVGSSFGVTGHTNSPEVACETRCTRPPTRGSSGVTYPGDGDRAEEVQKKPSIDLYRNLLQIWLVGIFRCKIGALCTTNMWGRGRAALHGNIDQSREHVGREVGPIQLV